jgi:hypothetical protein
LFCMCCVVLGASVGGYHMTPIPYPFLNDHITLFFTYE